MHTMEQFRPKELFEFEVETLTAKGVARYEHADPFRTQLPRGRFLFVPPQPKDFSMVIGPTMATKITVLDHVVGCIEMKGNRGRSYLDPQYVHDEIEVPEGPCLMLDVDDGTARPGITSPVSKANIIQGGRLPYTTWRGIIHAIVFPDVLLSRNMVLVGSRYESASGSASEPYLCLYEGEPRLDWYCWYAYAFPEWGVPSCGSIVIA